MTHFLMLNSIYVSGLHILIVCSSVQFLFIFRLQLDVVHVNKVIDLFLWSSKFVTAREFPMYLIEWHYCIANIDGESESLRKMPLWISPSTKAFPVNSTFQFIMASVIKVVILSHSLHIFRHSIGSGRIDTAVWMHYLDAI